jgi:hypothetical protein
VENCSECIQFYDEVQEATVQVPQHCFSWLGHTMEERSTDVYGINTVTIFWVNKSGVLGNLIHMRQSDDHIGYSPTLCDVMPIYWMNEKCTTKPTKGQSTQ